MNSAVQWLQKGVGKPPPFSFLLRAPCELSFLTGPAAACVGIEGLVGLYRRDHYYETL